MADTTHETETVRAPGAVLGGTCVAPGLVIGAVHRKDHDLVLAATERVPKGGLERELERFRSARERSRSQLVDLKRRLEGRVDAEDARVLDTHLTYLTDSVFVADVENLVLTEQLRLEAAIAKVVGDFDRIFRLVENQTLRQSAVDLRDVGIRVLRNLEPAGANGEEDVGPAHGSCAAGSPPGTADGGRYVLVSRELNIVDMFDLANEHVLGIATEEGALTSHAAIFARSMRIPTVTGIEGLLAAVREGDTVILDAAEGLLRVNPSDQIREQYRGAPAAERAGAAAEARVPDPLRTRDGEPLLLSASCGNLPEVERAVERGIAEIGLYRTELLYLVDAVPPSLDALRQHYASVLAAARGAVTFRLLNVDAGLEPPCLGAPAELKSPLGMVGVRVLLEHEPLLRRQLRALSLAAGPGRLRIAVPFVTDCGELQRVRAILREEREALARGEGLPDGRVELGAVVETPAALLGVRDLARESDFLSVNLDALLQHLLVADRDRAASGHRFRELHPFVLRALGKLAGVCEELGRELSVFGVSLAGNAAPLAGMGLARFCVAPSSLDGFLDEVSRLDLKEARLTARARAGRPALEHPGPGPSEAAAPPGD